MDRNDTVVGLQFWNVEDGQDACVFQLDFVDGHHESFAFAIDDVPAFDEKLTVALLHAATARTGRAGWSPMPVPVSKTTGPEQFMTAWRVAETKIDVSGDGFALTLRFRVGAGPDANVRTAVISDNGVGNLLLGLRAKLSERDQPR